MRNSNFFFYKFMKLFEIINVVEKQTYYFRFFPNLKNLFDFLCIFFEILLREFQCNEIEKYNAYK